MKRLWFAFKINGTAVYAGEDPVAACAAADSTEGPILSLIVEDGDRLPNSIRYVGTHRAIEVELSDAPTARPV